MTRHPQVFLSHASEDKKRFVTEFARRLREEGVDVWLDRWEILPGDSLVDKIFEEGIKEAEAMIIVLSQHSVDKPWVREELNAGVVKRIEGACRLIPVVIDDCEVPEALQSTLWQKIPDLESYDQEFNRIVAAVYGHSVRPPLGEPPAYTGLETNNLPSLTRVDTVVFQTICDASLANGSPWINVSQIVEQLEELGITRELMFESIDVLAEMYFIRGDRTLGSEGLDFFKITPHGFKQYATAFLENFEARLESVMLSIVNHELDTNKAIANHLDEDVILVDYIFDILDGRGFIKLSKTMGGNVSVYEVTTTGKRFARSL